MTLIAESVTDTGISVVEYNGPSLTELVESSNTRFILAVFTNLRGKPCAKLVPVSAVKQLENGELGFAGHAADAIGQTPKDPDLLVVPDASSFTPLGFIRPGMALVHCDPYVEGKPWKCAPRVILKRQLEIAKEKGFDMMVGAEIEYFLLRRGEAGELVVADGDDQDSHPCYDARGVTRMYEHLTSVSDAMNLLGWGNYANDHEDGNGQFEQNFTYDEALVTADRVITLRYVINMIAAERNMIASFMPKPFSDRTGSGMHMHTSLWSEGRPLFPDDKDPNGLDLSETAYHFAGGILEHAPGMHSLLCPTVNSYKRTNATTTASGATWSTNTVSFGGNDRTHYLRVPDGNRLELRGGDGSANPYLAMAVQLAAGLDGISRAIDPGAPGAKEGKTSLPPTLLHAVDALDADDVVRNALDAVGEGVANYYSQLKREEFFAWHHQVTPWEIDEYLTAL